MILDYKEKTFILVAMETGGMELTERAFDQLIKMPIARCDDAHRILDRINDEQKELETLLIELTATRPKTLETAMHILEMRHCIHAKTYMIQSLINDLNNI